MTHLFIGGRQADIDRNTVITFNYSAGDTDNPAAVKSTYSKTVELLGTENNNRIFNNLYDLKQHSLSFHSNKRTPFVLYSGGKQQTGYLKLDSVQRNVGGIVYRCTLIGELSDFFYNLAYNDKGEKKTFASLHYYFTDENGKVMGDREETHPIFSWDMDYIVESWNELYRYNPDSPTVNPRHVITAAPVYHGYGEDMDCKKMLVYYDSLTAEEKQMIPLPSNYNIYEKADGWFILENTREMDEFEARDLKSFNQCPAVKCSFLLDSISREENNGGYKVVWDDELKNSPYYQDTWVIMPKIDFGENSTQADFPFTSIDVPVPFDGYTQKEYQCPTSERVDVSTLDSVKVSMTVNLQLLLKKPYKNLYTSYILDNEDIYVYGGFAIRLKITSSSGTSYSRTHFITTRTGDSNDTGISYGYHVVDSVNRIAQEAYGTTWEDLIIHETDFICNDAYATLEKGIEISADIPSGDDVRVEMLIKYVSVNDYSKWTPLAVKNDNGTYTYVSYQCTPMLVEENTNGIYSSVPPKLQRTTVTKKTLFSSLCTPYEFLLSFVKMLGLKVIPTGKQIHIMPRNRYYTGEVAVLDGLVDLSKGIEIEPVLTQYKWHKYGIETPESFAGSLYKKKTDSPYGQLLVDTGYQFNNDTKDIMEDVVFENAIPYRLNSIYFNNIMTPTPLISPTFNVEFYDSDTDVKVCKGLSLSQKINRVYDGVPKLCLFDKDYKQSDFKNLLAFFTGMDNSRDYYVSDALQACEDYAGGQCYIFNSNENVYDDDLTTVTRLARKGIPCFTKYKADDGGNYTFSLDFKKPEYTFLGDESKYSESTTIYNRFFKRNVEDLYNPENRKITVSAFLHGEPNDLLRRFYYLDGNYWVMEKLSDYCYTSDIPQKITLVRINSTSNYTDNPLRFMKDVAYEDNTRSKARKPNMNGWVDMPESDEPVVPDEPDTPTEPDEPVVPDEPDTPTDKEYEVRYWIDGEKVHTDVYREGDEIVPIEAPEKEGYKFNVWIYEKDGQWVNLPAYMPAYNIDCYAHYIQIQYDEQYFTIEALEDGNITFDKSYLAKGNDMQYSTDNGNTWVLTQDNVPTQDFQTGTKILWKSTITPSYTQGYYGIGKFKVTGRYKIYGNIMSLLYGDRFNEGFELPYASFANLFYGSTTLTDASNLILPSMNLDFYCYMGMFQNCTSLTAAPKVLPATTLSLSCYERMFMGCTSLVTAPELPAVDLYEECYSRMFGGCTSLVEAPVLPASTLVDLCYNHMFDTCTNLNSVIMLATDISATKCLYNWLYGVGMQETGTVYKHPNMQADTLRDAVPVGWDIVDYQF